MAAAAAIVGRTGAASAAMDLSDGLAGAARAMAEASGVGVVIEAGAVPVHRGARAWAAAADLDPVTFALAGGEDYELVFAVAPRLRARFLAAAGRARDLPVTRVGRFVARTRRLARTDGAPESRSGRHRHFQHFGRNRLEFRGTRRLGHSELSKPISYKLSRCH